MWHVPPQEGDDTHAHDDSVQEPQSELSGYRHAGEAGRCAIGEAVGGDEQGYPGRDEDEVQRPLVADERPQQGVPHGRDERPRDAPGDDGRWREGREAQRHVGEPGEHEAEHEV